MTVAPAPLRFTPAAVPRLPVQRGPGAGLVLGVLALSFLLLGAAGFWLYGRFVTDSGPALTRGSSASEPAVPSTRDPEALIPDRAPPIADGGRPAVSAAEAVPPEPGSREELPLIPVTDDPADLEGLKAAVTAANARDIEALYAASPGERGPETRVALDVAIRALAKALYRHQVVDGHGDLDRARSELRLFLTGLEHQGLGLSEDAIEEGVAHVGP